MRFKYFIETVYGDIDELFLKGKELAEIDTEDYIIAYKSDIWILNEENFKEFNDEIFKKLEIKSVDETDNLYDFISKLNEGYLDVIVCRKESNSLVLTDLHGLRHSSASKTLLKLMNYLKADMIEVSTNETQEDEQDRIVQWKEDMKDISKDTVFYHGTTLEYFENMLVTGGIKPSPNQTNFDKIKHKDKIFLSLNLEKALGHAVIASRKTKGTPMIIGVTLPDISKLVPDYDVSLMIGNNKHIDNIKLGYEQISKIASGKKNNQIDLLLHRRVKKSGEDLNTKLGVFGYVGRIPVSFIKRIMYDFSTAMKHFANSEYGFDEEVTDYDTINQWENLKIYNLEDLKRKFAQTKKDIHDRTITYYGIEDQEEEEEDF